MRIKFYILHSGLSIGEEARERYKPYLPLFLTLKSLPQRFKELQTRDFPYEHAVLARGFIILRQGTPARGRTAVCVCLFSVLTRRLRVRTDKIKFIRVVICGSD